MRLRIALQSAVFVAFFFCALPAAFVLLNDRPEPATPYEPEHQAA